MFFQSPAKGWGAADKAKAVREWQRIIQGYIERRRVDRQKTMVENVKTEKMKRALQRGQGEAIRGEAATVQNIISVFNDGNIDSNDDSHNQECSFSGGQNRASSTLHLCDRCEMQSGNGHEAEMTAEQ